MYIRSNEYLFFQNSWYSLTGFNLKYVSKIPRKSKSGSNFSNTKTVSLVKRIELLYMIKFLETLLIVRIRHKVLCFGFVHENYSLLKPTSIEAEKYSLE